jgi:hypothetical protein
MKQGGVASRSLNSIYSWGGAKYNSSGTTVIGLADVTDSLMVIK